MSNPTPSLPARPSLEQLRKRAKELLRSARAGDPAAAERFRAADPLWSAGENPKDPLLADAQLVIAREHGFRSWATLVHRVEEIVGTPTDFLLGAMIRPQLSEQGCRVKTEKM